MHTPASHNNLFEPDEITALGPAVVYEVRDALEAVARHDAASKDRLKNAIAAFAERARAFTWPPEKTAEVLLRIHRNASSHAHAGSLESIATDGVDHVANTYATALALCMDAYTRERPHL